MQGMEHEYMDEDQTEAEPMSDGLSAEEVMMLLRMVLGVPKMARGGVVSRPTLAMIGEAGPEAVVPLGGGGGFGAMQRARRGLGRRNNNVVQGRGVAGDDPAGPGYLSRRLRMKAQRTADARRRSAGTLAGLAGLDPMQQRLSMVDADIEAGRGLSGALADAELQDASGDQDYYRNLLRDERQFQREKELRDAERGTLGGFLGQAAGSFIPGIGGAIASRIRR